MGESILVTDEVCDMPPTTKTNIFSKQNHTRIGLTVLVVSAILVFAVLTWVYRYNPIEQNLNLVGGQSSSYVIGSNGVKVHQTTAEIYVAGVPLINQVWNEPTSKFSVELVATIDNVGSRAVIVDQVGNPLRGYYSSSHFRVSFYKSGILGANAGATFRPFSLVGHSHRLVVVNYTQNCITAAVVAPGLTILNIPLTYSFAGFAHTVSVPIMPFTIETRPSC